MLTVFNKILSFLFFNDQWFRVDEATYSFEATNALDSDNDYMCYLSQQDNSGVTPLYFAGKRKASIVQTINAYTAILQFS